MVPSVTSEQSTKFKREHNLMVKIAGAERLHKATYATDKRNGGYLIRIVGPTASKFAGRTVPVTMKSGEEHEEKLLKMIWAGLDTGTKDQPGTGEPVALYKFESKPREEETQAEF